MMSDTARNTSVAATVAMAKPMMVNSCWIRPTMPSVSLNMPAGRASTASPKRASMAARASSAFCGSARTYCRAVSATSAPFPARSHTPS